MKQFALVMIIFLSFSTSSFAGKTIRITNGEQEPYLSEYVPHYGLYSHIVSEAFKLEGITIKWGFFSWVRALKIAEQGKKWDASAVWWPSEENKKEFMVSPLSLIISRNCKDGKFFLEKFNSSLKKLQDSGRIEQMYKDVDAGKYKKQKTKWSEQF